MNHDCAWPIFNLEFRDSLTEMDSRYPLSRAQASRE